MKCGAIVFGRRPAVSLNRVKRLMEGSTINLAGKLPNRRLYPPKRSEWPLATITTGRRCTEQNVAVRMAERTGRPRFYINERGEYGVYYPRILGRMDSQAEH